MTPFLALIAMGQPLDGEAAVAVAKKFLSRMRVAHVGGLNGLAELDGKGWNRPGKIWSVSFELPHDGFFGVLMTEAGKVFFASGKTTSGKVAPGKAEGFAKYLMAQVPNAIPVKLDSIGSNGESGDCAATFKAVLDGKPFFNLNPTYGYRLMFDAQGGLTWFGREDVLPSPVARVSHLSKAMATSLLESAWKATKPIPWPNPRYVEAELGYYKVKTEDQAHLVWQGQVYSVFNGQSHQFSMLETMVDATTGAFIKADDR